MIAVLMASGAFDRIEAGGGIVGGVLEMGGWWFEGWLVV